MNQQKILSYVDQKEGLQANFFGSSGVTKTQFQTCMEGKRGRLQALQEQVNGVANVLWIT